MFQYTMIFQLFVIVSQKLNRTKAIFLTSSIINAIIEGYNIFIKALKESKLIQFFNNIMGALGIYINNSRILNNTIKKDNSYLMCQESIFYKMLASLFNFPIELGRSIYGKWKQYFNASLIIKLTKDILRKFEIILSVVILITLLVPDSYWYNTYLLAIMIMIFVLYVFRVILLDYEGVDIKAISVFLWIFFISIVIAIVTSYDVKLSARFAAFHLVNFLIVIVLVSSIKTIKSLKSFVFVYAVGVFLTAVYGVWQAATGAIPFDPSFTDASMNQGMPGRIISTMGNANNYGEILIMAIPYLFVLFNSSKRKGYQFFTIIMGIVMLIALGYTGSRSSWVAFLCAVVLMVFLKKKSLLPVFILLGFLIIPFLPDFIWRRFMTIFQASSDSSTMYRLSILKTVVPIIKDYWVTGIGLGTDVFMNVADRYYYQYTLSTPLHTHILYTQILLETGILGAGSFLIFIYNSFKKMIINIKIQTDMFLKNILIASCSSLLGILLVGFLEYPWYYPRVMFFFWLNVGIVLVTLNIINRKKILPIS